MSDDTIADLAGAVMDLQEAFRRYDLEPAAIILSSREEGRALLCQVRDAAYSIQIVEHLITKEPMNQVMIAGTAIQWPALRRPRIGGGFDYV